MKTFLSTAKAILILTFIFNTLFGFNSFAQTAGDYRSVTTGNWITLTTWQRYNGSMWTTPTSVQGYPGQYTGTGNVLIQTGHTVTMGNGTVGGGLTDTKLMGTVTVQNSSQIYLSGANSMVTFYINSLLIDINTGGTIYFNNKAQLQLTNYAVVSLIVGSGALVGSCNNNNRVVIGSQSYGICAGAPGDIFTFAELMASGGTLNAKPTSNSPICEGSTINLSGNYAGAIGTAVTYSWSVTAPNSSVTVYNTQNVNISSAVPGTYSAALTVTTILSGTTYTNQETISVTVNPLPTLTAATQPITVCDGTPATIQLTGLVPSTTFTLNYKINNVAQTAKTGLVASAGGASSFTTPNLTTANNGQTLQITGITITSSSTNCAQTFAKDVTLSVWTTGAGTWTGTTNSDWNVTSNWCGGSVPIASTDVYISPNSASVLNQPVIGAAGGNSHNITINGSASLTISGSNTLSVYGDWANNGTFTPNTGTVSFAGSTAAQTIGGSGTNTFNNLTINNTYSGGGVKAGGNITVNGILDLAASNPSATVGALEMVSNYNGYPGATTTIPIVSYILTMGASATTTGQGDVTGKIYRSSVSANTAYTFGNQFTTYAYTVAPTDVTVIVTIGTAYGQTAVWGDLLSVKRSYEMIPTGGSGAKVSMNLHYLDSELNSNTEEYLVTGDYDIGPDGAPLGDEHGRSSYDYANNYIGLSGVPIDYFIFNPSTHNWRTVFTLHDFREGHMTWTGSVSTAWNNENNWSPVGGLPGAATVVTIPDVSNDPIVPTGGVTIGGIQILDGGNVDFNSETITLAGYNYSGWEDQSGLSNYSGSTVVISNTTVPTPVSGVPHFNNLTINSDAILTVHPNSHIYISGTLTKTGSFDAGTFNNIVEYNGASQTVAMPDGNNKYYNLTLSGSGTKTLPSSAISIFSNLTLAGTATTAPTHSITIGGNLTLGSGTTFAAGSLTHNLSGNFINNGGTFTNTGSTINLNGTVAQSIGGSSSTTFNNLIINNASGVTLGINETVDGILNLTSGLVTTDSYTLTSGCSGSITNAGASSYINGKLARIYCSTGSKDFSIGKGGNFRQLSLNYTALSGTSTVTAEQFESTIAGSIPANTTVQTGRYWNISQTGGSSFTYNLTLNGSPFTPGSGTAKILKGDGANNTAYAATFSSPSFTASGLTSFSNFAVASECTPATIDVQPIQLITCAGEGTPTFTVTASGSGLSYQWEESTTGIYGTFNPITDGGLYSNTTTAALTITKPPYTMNDYAYRVIISRDCGSITTSDAAPLTVYELIAGTLGGSPSVCTGTATANLSYSITSGEPDEYKIDFDAAAEAEGFSDVSYTNLPSSPITINVPSSAGTYNGILNLKSFKYGCESEGYPFTVTIYPLPQGSLSGNTIYSCGGTGQLTWTATTGSGPFTVIYNDGIDDRTALNVNSGIAFNVFFQSRNYYRLHSCFGFRCSCLPSNIWFYWWKCNYNRINIWLMDRHKQLRLEHIWQLVWRYRTQFRYRCRYIIRNTE